MRIPFPERIPFYYALCFALLLASIELLEGTDITFCTGVAVFVLLSTLAFNTAGGFTRPSGSYIFFNAVLTGILGLIYKAWLGEAAQTNLTIPHMTILVYDLGMAGMLVAAYLSRRFSRREGWLQDALPLNRMQSAVYGCLGVGMLLVIINRTSGGSNGSIMSAVNQVDRFLTMAILLGVTHQIRKSGGRSCLNLPVVAVMLWDIGSGGLMGFSKEAFLMPIMAWLLTAASLRYRFSLLQIAGLIVGTCFLFYYLVPYSQYGRNFRSVDVTFSSQVDRAIELVSNLNQTREKEKEIETESSIDNPVHYYDRPQGFWDRLEMLSIDDQIINFTEKQHAFGYFPIIFGIENAVPRFLWKSKPTIVFGNVYAHEVGMLSPDDTSTGIAFSPQGESWHIGRWICLTLVAPVIWTVFFVVFDSLAGDVRKSPWGLLAIVLLAHIASEGGINSVLYELAYGVAAILVVAFFSAKIMPVLGTLVIGPGRTTLTRTPTVQSIPRRSTPL